MKLCKDCVHLYGSSFCARKAYREDFIHGREWVDLREIKRCSEERAAWLFGCGKSGKYFKERGND